MRVGCRLALTVALAVPSLVIVSGQGTDATKILAAAREALGGEQKLAAVKTFVATGRTRQVRGDNLVPIEFEISCELPDKYVRKDEIPAQESGPTSTGFNGEELIQLPPSPPPPPQAARPAATPTPPPSPGGAVVVPGAPAAPAGAKPAASGGLPPDPRKARVAAVKQDFAKLTLGMFATSFSSYPLTFSVAGQAEAPQGRADVIDVKGPGSFALRFFINSETHLPIMVSWTTPVTNVVPSIPGQLPPQNLPPGAVVFQSLAPPPATASKEEQDKYAKEMQDLRKRALMQAKPIENRIYYADYREVGNGVRFPFRLRRAVAGDTVEETNFDGFRINARIDARRFEVVKPPTGLLPQ